MKRGTERVAALVTGLEPFDELEAHDQANVLRWLESTADIYRRVRPATPAQHLVAYFLLHHHADGSLLLVHHRKAGLWLPTGGHVDVGEDPADTVRREVAEELGINARFTDPDARPLFVTVTQTTGSQEERHTDVSLWYLLDGTPTDVLRPDDREFSAVRWWTRTEVAAADPAGFDPQLPRFLAKIDAPPRPTPRRAIDAEPHVT